jgi:predicted site-specific integrase-resolvase
LKLLTEPTIGVIVVEHRDRGTRFGFIYIEQLVAMQGRRLEVVFPKETDDDLVNDFVSMITSMAARIYGRRNSRRKAEQIKQCVEQVMKQEV